MIDLHGRSILLGAIIIFSYNILFSIFSLFVSNMYYKTVFLMFSVLSNAIGIILLLVVYIKLYLIIRNILNEDVGLKNILKGKKKKGKKKDDGCTYPYCDYNTCDWDGIREECPKYIEKSKEE
ncbi:hypothetical protein LCGC14_0559920 [marine sediment metagenome]|uniref:Uncharacterized protein n=1 Tax=marine sediment metagenome TaxID=412755 RepID=A0A0F9RM22_9ZZZZ